MSSTVFYAVPRKSTIEVDLVKPLMKYIETVFPGAHDVSPEIKEAVQELNKLRNKACIQPLEKNRSSLELLTQYYDQLVCIKDKLPITPTLNPIPFKWKNAFDKGTLFFGRASLILSDGCFERAAVLFNCAAFSSEIAASLNHAKDSELQAATKHFQEAAGMFLLIRERELNFSDEATTDLHPNTLGLLSSLMLAQAQEALFLKGEKEKIKLSALQKVAAGCTELYGEVQKLIERDGLKSLFDKEWSNILYGKYLAFNAIANYYAAQICWEKSEISVGLSRLSEAVKLSQKATSYLSDSLFSKQFADIVKDNQVKVKENAFIFHEKEVDYHTLPALPNIVLVKAISMEPPLSHSFDDKFSSLVSVEVQEAMALFEAQKNEIVNRETTYLRERSQELNDILASMNLPAALDDAVASELLPESIRQKSAKVRVDGGIESITKLIADLPDQFKKNQDLLDEVTKLLEEERIHDDFHRLQFGEKWSRMKSEKLTEPFRQEYGKFKGILQSAERADKIVISKLEESREAIRLLSLPENELRASIPGLDAVKVNKNLEPVTRLRSLMEDVQDIKREREQLENELKRTGSSCLTDKFFKSGSGDKRNLSEVFDPWRKKRDSNIERQEKCLAEILTWNQKFASDKSSTTQAMDRERMLKLLAGGYDRFLEIKSNLEEGSKFYTDLNPLLARLQQKVSDFCFARKTEKEDLIQHFKRVGTFESPSKGAAVPPRPPPPKSTNPFDDVEGPIAPPRNVSSLQATNEMAGLSLNASVPATSTVNQAQAFQPQMYGSPYVQPQQQYVQYAQPPNFQPPPQYAPYPGYSYTTPYPLVYPTTYPGAPAMQPGGSFPPQPQHGNPTPP